MSTALDLLARGKYLSLTTYRRDGTPVATPVWLVRVGEDLRVITDADSGKVKRLRSDPRVTVAPCDARGRLTGPATEGRARLLEDGETARTMDLIKRRYGVLGRFLMWRGRNGRRIAIGISLAGASSDVDRG